ncbi:MAG: hypothetical protein FWF22_03585 [Treponema sp.]|nr:hypothetical protein [Treponema sp.]
MIDLKQLQKRVYDNKVAKHFNVTDIYMEFCYAYGELSEACDAYIKKQNTVGEEMADVVLYLLGLSEILGIDLEKELIRKIEINEKRKYIQENGVNIRLEG